MIMIYQSEQSLKDRIDFEKKELFSRIQSDFWHPLFYGVLKKHTYQNDFFFVESHLSVEKVINSLEGLLYDLCHIYGLECKKTNNHNSTQLKLIFDYYDCNNNKALVEDELLIDINNKNISVTVLLNNSMLKKFLLEEYVLVGNIMKEICEQVFVNQKKKYGELRNNFKKILLCADGLTPKTIEIAQNSIRTLYEASEERNKNLVQRNLYSSMLCKGRIIRIFHKDFLENPDVLIKELNN